MSAGVVTLTFNNKTATVSRFSDTAFPRSYMAQASLEFSQIGTAYASGPARRQRQMWSISAYVTAEEWEDIEDVYIAWDRQRAQGDNLAYVNIEDGLLGTPKTYKAFFTEPPVLTKLSPGNNTDYNASFVLVEV